jgi:hypothetical protein
MADTTSSSPLGDLASSMAQGMSYGQTAPNPISFDPGLLLSAVGASSPARTGDAASSISAAGDDGPSDGEKLRTQAAGLLSAAQPAAIPAPQMRTPSYSPFETAVMAAIGGGLNAASGRSGQGTMALNAYMASKLQGAQADYQNEVNRHASAIQTAQEAYRMAQDQANPLLQQAGQDDASDRQDQQQKFEATQAGELAASQLHEDQLKQMYAEFSKDESVDSATKLQQQRILQEKLVDVMAQTGAGRALLAAEAGSALGRSHSEIVQMARVAALSPSHLISAKAKEQLRQEGIAFALPSPVGKK